MLTNAQLVTEAASNIATTRMGLTIVHVVMDGNLIQMDTHAMVK